MKNSTDADPKISNENKKYMKEILKLNFGSIILR